MSKKYTVYKYTFEDGSVYIGHTGNPVSRRGCGGANYARQPEVFKSIKQSGWDYVKEHREVLYTFDTKEEAKAAERAVTLQHVRDGYIVRNTHNTVPRFKKTYIIEETGDEYHTQTEIALALGCTKQNVSYAIKHGNKVCGNTIQVIIEEV